MVELTIPRLGDERSKWQYPIGSLVRSGAKVSFGSDWPITSLNPMEGIAGCRHAADPWGDPPGGWLPDERVDLDTAIRLYTAAGAYQGFEENEVGTHRPSGSGPTWCCSAPISTKPLLSNWGRSPSRRSGSTARWSRAERSDHPRFGAGDRHQGSRAPRQNEGGTRPGHRVGVRV